jgi:hypothetical protein
MSDMIHPATLRVARDLNTAEISTDAQIEASAKLMISIIQGRHANGLPFGATQGAMSDAGEAISLALRSRHHLARAHQRLRETAVSHDLVTGHGDLAPICPEELMPGETGATPLRVVNG